MEIKVSVNEDLYRRFAAACVLTGKDQEVVISEKIQEFVTATFISEISELNVSAQGEAQMQSKVETRIPLWAKRTEQHNHRILQTFFAVEHDGMTTKERMREFFLQNGYGTPWQFDNNFASMRTNEGNSHGNVFSCVNDIVTLTDEASSVAYKYRDSFLEGVTPDTIAEHQEKNAASVQQRLFISWFKEQLYRGKPYNPVTISGYSGRIESACKDSAFDTIEPKNLFEIKDYDQFMAIRQKIMVCPGFEAFDLKSHRGFTAALNKYADFLMSRG